MTKLFLTAALAAPLIAGPALAQSAPRPAPATIAAPVRTAAIVTRADLDRTLAADFAKMDSNNDGSISAAEIASAASEGAAEARRRYDENASTTFRSLDKDGNGQVSEAEFKAGLPPFAAPRIDAAAIVRGYDSNKDGKISPAEHGAPKVAEFNRFDTDKDGRLTAAEQQGTPRRAPATSR